jgi:transcriptional regulator with XRE-family HTH domain
LSIGFLNFSELFSFFCYGRIDFSKLLWYNIEKGGDDMYSERTDSCGDRIKRGLKIRGMRQADLCQLTKIPKSAISQYISGAFEPKQDRIYLISKALNVSEAWLMGYDVPMERQKITSPEEPVLSEGEKIMLDLFRKIPEDQQQLYLRILRSALGSQEQ